MPSAPTPTPKDVERALRRLTAGQFAQVCSEVGILEVTLPGNTQAARATSLVEKTRGKPDFVVLARAINRVEPKAWRPVAARGAASSLVYALVSFAVILGLGGLALMVVLSGSEQPTPTPLPTETLPPTRTPVPTFTHTPTNTPVPTSTPTATPTPTPTRTQAVATSGLRATATLTPPPPVAIIYPQLELQRPPSGSRVYPGATVDFRWLLRNASIKPDERYWMRLYASGSLVDGYLTSDPWRLYPVPPGAVGTFNWTVTVVKVDAANTVIGPLSPESDAWVISWQP
ncbi:MAG TPA: hypothetical protein VJG32_01005 [Anaerolineae bacterium]|nr:hypothetical protein [Anaerolineae bacterium]